jgi:MraZ protein
MLLGEYEHTLDDKNRLTLPAKFRQVFADGIVLTRGMDGCLYGYAKPEWESFVEGRLEQLDPLSREARQMSRFLFAGAAETEPDRQGRVMVPAPLLAHGKLEREVVVAGVRDHIEIWDRATWRQHVQEVEGSVESVAERLAQQRD